MKKWLFCAMAGAGLFLVASSEPTFAANGRLQLAFSWVKDAYLVSVEKNRNHKKEWHGNWCAGQPDKNCKAELKRYLSILKPLAKTSNLGLEHTCYIAANLKYAREHLSGNVSGGWSGHYGWCKGNPQHATGFAQDEVKFMNLYFQ